MLPISERLQPETIRTYQELIRKIAAIVHTLQVPLVIFERHAFLLYVQYEKEKTMSWRLTLICGLCWSVFSMMIEYAST